MARLDGKTAIVTGGASGFGAGIVRKFVDEGARVLIADINGDGAAALAKELGAKSQQVDVSKDASVAALVDAAYAAFGKLDILVNNAGVSHLPAPLDEISEADFDRVLAVNVKSVYLTAKHAVPRFKAAKSGVILNVASTAAVSPRPRLSWYNASKGWMVTATKSMAVELAPLGIRVNAINPVAGETPLLKTFMGEDTEEIRKKFRDSIPLGRLLKPEDLAEAAAFVASPQAAMITGVALDVDGGRSI